MSKDIKTIEQFKALLAAHDFFYAMSDDSRVVKRGQAERDQIEALAKKNTEFAKTWADFQDAKNNQVRNAEQRNVSATTEAPAAAVEVYSQPGALVLASDDYAQYADAGFEDVREEDLAPPLLLLAQSNTPEVKRQEARIGDLICRVLKRVWTLPVQFIPICTTLKFVVWKPLNQGGGFVASLEPDHPDVVDALRRQPMGKKQLTRVIEGNRVTFDLVQTQYLSLLLNDPESETWMPVILPLTSTKLTPFRQFLTQARNLRGKRPDGTSFSYPLFAHQWQLGRRTQVKHNQESEVVTFELAGSNASEARVPANSPQFLMAAAYHKRMRDGGIVIDDAQQTQDVADDGYADDRGYSQGSGGYDQASGAPF